VNQFVSSIAVLLLSVGLLHGCAQPEIGKGFIPDENGTNLDEPPKVKKSTASELIIYFDINSSIIDAKARPIIEAQGKRLRADPNLHVALEGHAAESAVRELNLALGQKRAESVRKALSLMGVPDRQMEAVSFGSEKPVIPGLSATDMQKNLRVEINFR